MLAAVENSRLKLATYSTCEISDALIKQGTPHGGFVPDIAEMTSAASSQARLCGQAYTVQMVLTSDNTAPRLSAHFVDTAPEGYVIVISAPRSVSVLSLAMLSY